MFSFNFKFKLFIFLIIIFYDSNYFIFYQQKYLLQKKKNKNISFDSDIHFRSSKIINKKGRRASSLIGFNREINFKNIIKKYFLQRHLQP